MKRKTLSLFIFLATIAIITLPLALLASADTTDNVTVTAGIQSAAPTITWVETGLNTTPAAGTTNTILIRFNATDGNGVGDFDDATAKMNLTNGATVKTSTSCTSAGLSGTMDSWSCNFTINYYDVAGSWNITAAINDLSAQGDTDDSGSFTVNDLDDVSVTQPSISFTGLPGATNVAASPNPVNVMNTGNQNYATVGVTAHDLSGGGDTIPATAFNVNISDSPEGQALADGSPVQVTSSTLARGSGAQRNIYFYLDIPAAIANTSYSSAAWTFDPTV